MQLKSKILCFYLLFFIGCENKQKVVSKEEISRDSTIKQKDSIITIDNEASDSIETTSYKYITGGHSFKKRNVTVLTIEKTNSRYASTGEDLGVQCDNWKLDKKAIERILRESIPITGHEWHYLYAVWPCYFQGSVKINGVVCHYAINAGAYVKIQGKDS